MNDLATASPRHQVTRVAFIAGWGRSGSTLLDRLLNGLPGVVAVGELRDLWLRGPVEDRTCACGARFSQCPFWRAVGARLGGWDRAEAEQLARLRLLVDRPWYLPHLLGPQWFPAHQRRLQVYAERTAAVYRAIAEVAGADVVGDSSKIPTSALVLRRSEHLEVRAVHLVRDSRGVLDSWRRSVERLDGQAGETLARYRLLPGIARYVGYNAMVRCLPAARIPTVRVRYEDLAAEPEATVATVAAHLGVAPLPDAVSTDGGFQLPVSHQIDGNPMRFRQGPLEIRLDERWRHAPAWWRWTVAALSAPSLLAYGYLRRPAAPSQHRDRPGSASQEDRRPATRAAG